MLLLDVRTRGNLNFEDIPAVADEMWRLAKKDGVTLQLYISLNFD